MRRLYSGLLFVCLILGMIVPAYAAEEALDTPPVETEAKPVEVGTLEELQDAIEVAENGSTILITKRITVAGAVLSTEKNITVACSSEFSDRDMFCIADSTIDGFSFKGGRASRIFNLSCDETEIDINNCIFDGENVAIAIDVYMGAVPSYVEITDCEFKNCMESSISAKGNTEVVMSNCYIHDSYDKNAHGAIFSAGKIVLDNCTITGNAAFANGGVNCYGTLIVSGGVIRDNVARSTEGGAAVDIYCSGTWSITDDEHDGAGYYDVLTGEKIALPISESGVLAKLVYLDDDKAADFLSLFLVRIMI